MERAAVARRPEELMLVLATAAVVAVAPEWALSNLVDPSYWGVVGFAMLVLLLLGLGGRSWAPGSSNRRLVLAFLVSLPLLYLAHWLRFGGSMLELAIQLSGLVIWLAFAAMGRRSDTPLWVGCVLHGLWDAAHFGRVDFVPQWYGAMCIAADVALGAYVMIELEKARPTRARF